MSVSLPSWTRTLSKKRQAELRRILDREEARMDSIQRACEGFMEIMVKEERAKIPERERVREYNAGYENAIKDGVAAKFPGWMSMGSGGFQKFAIDGLSPRPQADGRLKLQ